MGKKQYNIGMKLLEFQEMIIEVRLPIKHFLKQFLSHKTIFGHSTILDQGRSKSFKKT
jgi:hypothetical protein